MNKVISIFIIISVFCTCAVAHARSAADFFVDIPTNLVPLVRPQLRMDMVDYYASGQETPVRNVFGGDSRILDNSPEQIVVQLSNRALMEVDVLTAGSDTIIALVSTTATPQPDSRIVLYSTDWTPLAVQPEMPGASDFAPKGDRTDWNREVPMFFVSTTYVPETGMFVFTNNTPRYYHPTETPAALSRLPERISLRWTGKKWSAR